MLAGGIGNFRDAAVSNRLRGASQGWASCPSGESREKDSPRNVLSESSIPIGSASLPSFAQLPTYRNVHLNKPSDTFTGHFYFGNLHISECHSRTLNTSPGL